LRGNLLWIETLEKAVAKHSPPGIVSIDRNGRWILGRRQVDLNRDARAVLLSGGVAVVKADGSLARPGSFGSDAHQYTDELGEWRIFTI
jgi:hypothetical protein